MNNPTKEVKTNLRRRRIMKKNNQGGKDLIKIIKGDIEIKERMIFEELKLKSLHFKEKVILRHTWNGKCVYLKSKKVKLAALEFTNYALFWWGQM
ncbi:hypothetical protein CR513_20596, partial [Mucuna pruriens]